MLQKIKATLPLAIVVGILAYAWTHFALSFSFHWVTAGDLGNGLELPANFQLIVPAGFIGWGFFFAAGADNRAVVKVGTAILSGGLAALATMALSSKTADFPDFWGIAVWVGVMSVPLIILGVFDEWTYVPASFGAFAAVFYYWIATGLDFWTPGGGGSENTVNSLSDPATAGTGAFGGVISTPFGWVWAGVTASLFCGVVLGVLSVKLASFFARQRQAGVDDMAEAEVDTRQGTRVKGR
ncbi:DUF1097 domain-containing protein [Nocardioides immobilis]|uniref:DUF1097 domain-containing protein n=2 Tax=Nocardioides immobilis TaxID=2049295 RepID=A0A417Y9G3_9ACTN|nr:DUF1097 domain-containing protein [Nocardioides immobilis]